MNKIESFLDAYYSVIYEVISNQLFHESDSKNLNCHEHLHTLYMKSFIKCMHIIYFKHESII